MSSDTSSPACLRSGPPYLEPAPDTGLWLPVAHGNDEKAWREFLMMPQCLLCAPPRCGRRHAKAVAAYTLDRFQRWQEGERMSLWSTRPARRPARTAAPTLDEQRSLAISLAREWFDRKALHCLAFKRPLS